MQDRPTADGTEDGDISPWERDAVIDNWFHCLLEVGGDTINEMIRWLNDEHGDPHMRHTHLARLRKAKELFDNVPR